MKHKTNFIIFALMLLSISASAQIQFTAGLNYESGVPSGAPSSTGSRIRVNLATGRAYIWNQAGSNWRVLAQGIDIVAGCSAPLYTPGYGQSLFAVNGCASPELYYYTGTAWVQINAGGGGGGTTYYAGEGIDITNDTINVDTVQRLSFRTDQTYSDGLGTLSWDDTNGTLQLGLKGGNVSLQLGQESVQLVKHADNTGLSNGKVVYLTGSSGGNLTVRYAQANSESTSANTFGVMTEDATGGNKAFCTTFGLVHNINTSNLTEGGMVWLSKDTAGAMTAVRPTAPNNGVEVGFCVTKHATNGVIFVTVQNGYELDELHNVYVPAPTNGQVLTYNTTNTRWEAATVADQSATNELQTIDTFSLSGQTLSASLSSDAQPAKTVTLPVTNVTAGTGISVSSTTGNYTVTNSAPDQTVSITNGGGVGVTGSYPSFTLTATDQSVTNEIQRLDTFSLSGQTLSASLLNDGVAASSVTLPIVDVVAGTNVTVTKSNGVATVNATGGGSLSGVTGYISQFNSSTTIDTTGLFWNGRLGINTASPSARLDIVGEGITSGTSAIEINSSSSELFKINNNGQILIGENSSSLSTSRTAAIEVTSANTNVNIAVIPKGSGGIISDIPDGSANGGNARGTNVIDFTLQRNSAGQCATGNNSIAIGNFVTSTGGGVSIGYDCSSTGSGAIAIGGYPVSGTVNASGTASIAMGGNARASNTYSISIGGGNNNASGYASTIIGGQDNEATGNTSIVYGGRYGLAYLLGQATISGRRFGSGLGDAQTSNIRLMREITGTATSELTLDGTAPALATRATLPLPTGSANGRLWNVVIQLSAICRTAGGSVTVGESFIGEYNCGIKRIGNTTSLVGTVQNITAAQSDTNMSTSVVTITADDGNDCLKIEFTPPSGANASTVIRVVATVYLTEVGY